MFGKLQDLAADFGDDGGFVLGFAAFENVLDYVVAVLVLDEADGEAMEFIEKGLNLN